jgi:hypothetical protein
LEFFYGEAEEAEAVPKDEVVVVDERGHGRWWRLLLVHELLVRDVVVVFELFFLIF